MPYPDAMIRRLPGPVQRFALRHRELIKFAIVGATTFVIDSSIFYTLKLTILEPKPVTAKVIAGIVAVIASYILNREWSFRDRGGRERHHEAFLFFAVSGVGVVLSMAPLVFSSYVLGLRVPDVSLTVENVADFVAAYVIGNLLQMGFRFWAFRRWVFPEEFERSPETAIETALTVGGTIDAIEGQWDSADRSTDRSAPGTSMRSPTRRRPLGRIVDHSSEGIAARLPDSSASDVSKTP